MILERMILERMIFFRLWHISQWYPITKQNILKLSTTSHHDGITKNNSNT